MLNIKELAGSLMCDCMYNTKHEAFENCNGCTTEDLKDFPEFGKGEFSFRISNSRGRFIGDSTERWCKVFIILTEKKLCKFFPQFEGLLQTLQTLDIFNNPTILDETVAVFGNIKGMSELEAELRKFLFWASQKMGFMIEVPSKELESENEQLKKELEESKKELTKIKQELEESKKEVKKINTGIDVWTANTMTRKFWGGGFVKFPVKNATEMAGMFKRIEADSI